MNVRPEFHEVLQGDHELDMEANALCIGGVRAQKLADQYGTPLFVIVENALARNYRMMKEALERHWPAPSSIFFSVKSNPNLKIAKYFASLGAGMDVFSSNELRAAVLAAGRDIPIVLNGSAKEASALRLLAEIGGTINIDSVEEIEELEAIISAYRQPINVNIRLKPDASFFAEVASDYFGVAAGEPIMAFLDDEKWGFSVEATVGLVRRLQSSKAFKLLGFSSHIGRISIDPQVFEIYGRSLASMTEKITDATGFVPKVMDAGGGWPRRRDPESRGFALNEHPITDYVAAFAKGFREGWADRPLPDLWTEPGRYLVGSSVVLLSRVIARKADINRVWITVDTSTNHLARVDTSRSKYFVVPALADKTLPNETVEVVGPTCVHSVLASKYRMPRLEVGALVAVLDAGMYAESTANNFNLLPRPAAVYVSDAKVELIRRAETFEDILRTQLDLWKE